MCQKTSTRLLEGQVQQGCVLLVLCLDDTDVLESHCSLKKTQNVFLESLMLSGFSRVVWIDESRFRKNAFQPRKSAEEEALLCEQPFQLLVLGIKVN